MIRPLAALALVAAPAAAQLSALKGHNSNAPVDVTADRIEVQDRANQAAFVGRVHVVQGDLVMDAGRMTVSYARAPSAGADPQIQRIDASGGVTVTDPSEKATGSFGIYDINRRLITLIGGVTLTRGGNTVRGARLVINLDTGRASVDGSAVGGAAGSTTSSGGRVTGRFSVPQRSQGAASAPPPR
jgi:lipopolysaccharide export system protein LptA